VSVYRFIRPLLFRLDPERAHSFALGASGALGRLGAVRAAASQRWGAPRDPRLATKRRGYRVSNPVGLGAGYDKSGDAIPLISRLGFGFLEIGSVSRWALGGQSGSPTRLSPAADEALVVNYGVPNDGPMSWPRVFGALRAPFRSA